jgi:hypothetical protein
MRGKERDVEEIENLAQTRLNCATFKIRVEEKFDAIRRK